MWMLIDINYEIIHFQEEQEEIIRKRPSDQKGLNLKEIKQMEYLPKVWSFSIFHSFGNAIFHNETFGQCF
jgi:hypothetical protein